MNNKRVLFILFNIFFGVIYLSACKTGDDEQYFSIKGVTVLYNVPSYVHGGGYFNFQTNDANNNNDTFLGTAVYYKIYKSYSTMLKHNSSISAINTESQGSAAYKKMAQEYLYQEIGTDAGIKSPLIPANKGIDRKVIIYLNDYENPDRKFEICWKDITDKAYTRKYTPMRFGNVLSFNLSCSASPTDEDIDTDVTLVEDDPEAGTDNWYVDMYAVSVGMDSRYSLVAHLGSVNIKN